MSHVADLLERVSKLEDQVFTLQNSLKAAIKAPKQPKKTKNNTSKK